MQDKSASRPNEVRTAEMRARLLGAARALFAEKGFAETGTPEIVRRANVTRGALYHHFADKVDLFRAVIVAEAGALARDIDEAALAGAGRDSLDEGTRAFFSAMKVPGRARLLLIDGPAVLGWQEMDTIDAGAGRASLQAGIAAGCAPMPEAELTALATVLSAGFDRAALAVADGADPAPYLAAFERLIAGLR